MNDLLFLSYDYIYFQSPSNTYLLLNLKTNTVRKINKNTYNLLEYCNGNYNYDEILNLYNNGQKEELASAINKLLELGVINTYNYRKEKLENILMSKIYINVTKKCNLRCGFCLSNNEKSDRLVLEDYISFIHKIIDIWGSKPIICLTGGEPLVSNLFWDIANECFNNKFEVCLLTNGTQINESNYRKFYLFTNIGISIDSYLEQKHDRIRGVNGAFLKTLNALDLLSSLNNVKVWIQSTVSSDNIEEMEYIAEIAQKKHLAGIRYSLLHNVGHAQNITNLTSDTYFKYFQQINKIKCKYPDLLINESFQGKDTEYFGRLGLSCGVDSSILLDSSGEISLCPGLIEKSDYKIHYEINWLNNFKDNDNIQRIRSSIIEDWPICTNCSIRHYCKGSCIAEHVVCSKEKREGMMKWIDYCIKKIM